MPKLEALSARGGENNSMEQMQSRTTTLTLKLQDLMKGKEKKEDVWCIIFQIDGHNRNECKLLIKYLVMDIVNPLAQGRGM